MCSFRHASQHLLTPGQYGMSYRQAKPSEIARKERMVGQLSPIQYIVTGTEDEGIHRPLLEAHWAEGRLMVLRTKPVLMYVEYSKKKDEHRCLYGELILYLPWNGRDEAREFGSSRHDQDACRVHHAREKAAIDRVKEGLQNLLLEQM